MSTPKPAARRTRASSSPAPGAAPNAVAEPAAEPAVDPQHEVEVEAYLIAEQRGFAEGQELADWLEAERRVASRHA